MSTTTEFSIVSSFGLFVMRCSPTALASPPAPKKLRLLPSPQNPYKTDSPFQGIRNAESSDAEYRSASSPADRCRNGKLYRRGQTPGARYVCHQLRDRHAGTTARSFAVRS